MEPKPTPIQTSDQPGRKIGYARCSTKEQKLDLQLDALKEAGCEMIFQEKMSGMIDDRPEFTKALKELRENDILVVWKLDRMGRSMRNLLDIIDLIQAKGASFRSLTEGLGGTGPMATMTLAIFAALAQYERELSRERIMAGIEAYKEAGGKLGHRRGTRHSTSKEDDEQMLQWVDAGIACKKIAMKFNVAPITVYRMIRLRREGIAPIYPIKKDEATQKTYELKA